MFSKHPLHVQFDQQISNLSLLLKIHKDFLPILYLKFNLDSYVLDINNRKKSIKWEEFSYYSTWVKCFMARNIGEISDSWISVKLNHTYSSKTNKIREKDYIIWLSDPKYFILTNHPGGTPCVYKAKSLVNVSIHPVNIIILNNIKLIRLSSSGPGPRSISNL